jgi:hypothetical protein
MLECSIEVETEQYNLTSELEELQRRPSYSVIARVLRLSQLCVSVRHARVLLPNRDISVKV